MIGVDSEVSVQITVPVGGERRALLVHFFPQPLCAQCRPALKQAQRVVLQPEPGEHWQQEAGASRTHGAPTYEKMIPAYSHASFRW